MINSKIRNYVGMLCEKLNIGDYIGIIVYGSYVGGRNNTLSDLDVMVIKSNYNTQDCGSSIIDGIRVEYFIQDIKKLYELIKKEVENNDPSHLTKFATCEILCDSDDTIKEFIEYAKILYNTRILTSFSDTDKFSIFSINNRIEDLESLIDCDSFYAVYYITLERIRTLYARMNGIIDLPIMKIERIYKDKDFAGKYISSPTHKLPDPGFIEKYLICLNIDDRTIMLRNIKDLYKYSFGQFDFDPNNFHLQYTNKAPFRV